MGDLSELFRQPDWQQNAQCIGTDNSVFFGHAKGTYYKDETKVKETELDRIAKSICKVCIVQAECLDFAITTGQTEGIWGGSTPKERRRIRRQQLRSAG